MTAPVMDLSNSADRCPVLPCPGDPCESLPGFALAYVMRSGRFFAASEFVTTTMFGTSATRLIGAKSRTASNCSFG
jgi:hypothetical protein